MEKRTLIVQKAKGGSFKVLNPASKTYFTTNIVII